MMPVLTRFVQMESRMCVIRQASCMKTRLALHTFNK